MPLPLKTFWHWLQRRLNRTPKSSVRQVKVCAVRPLPSPHPAQLSASRHPISSAVVPSTPVEHVPVRVVSCRVLPPDPGPEQPAEPERSRHIERNQLVVRPFTPDEAYETGQETWERRGNSFHTTQSQSLVLTPNNMLIPPDGVVGFCSNCGGPDQDLYTCGRTGVHLCRACVTFFPLYNDPVPITRQAATQLRERLSSWEQHDIEKGLMKRAALVRLFPFHDPRVSL